MFLPKNQRLDWLLLAVANTRWIELLAPQPGGKILAARLPARHSLSPNPDTLAPAADENSLEYALIPSFRGQSVASLPLLQGQSLQNTDTFCGNRLPKNHNSAITHRNSKQPLFMAQRLLYQNSVPLPSKEVYMAQPPVTCDQDRSNALLSPLVLALLLLLYGAGMMALPIYFFGLTIGLWLSGALMIGGVGVVVVLAGSNRAQEAPQQAVPQPRVMHLTPAPAHPWVRPRITPYQQ